MCWEFQRIFWETPKPSFYPSKVHFAPYRGLDVSLHRTMASPSDPSQQPTNNASTSPPVQTATWLRYLPESFGIRAAIAASPYRWCARESALWGIATGTAMALHRLRMNPRAVVFAVNVGFGTTAVVLGTSYLVCVRKRDYQEQMIELMMQYNAFAPAEEMPEQIPMDERHPFVAPIEAEEESAAKNVEYFGVLEERKEWQAQLPSQDPKDVFQPSSGGNPKR